MATTSSISSTSSTSSQLETLATQYKSVLTAQYVTPLDNKKTTLQARLNALSTLRTKLKTLSDAATALTGSSGITKFKVYTVESSNTTVATATASALSSPGAYTLSVSSLAKSDTILSSRLSNTDTSVVTSELTPEEVTAGEATRQIRLTINGSEITTVSVTLSASDTNSTVLQKIRDAINNSADASQQVSAAVVTDTATTSRLTIVSKTTGSVYAVGLEDVSGTLLDNIGLGDTVVSNRSTSTSTTGGYVYGAASNLNAQFTLNGVEFTSSTNTVSDALPGITLQLKSVQSPTDAPVQLNVSIDTSAVQSNIQSLITAYNSVVTYIKQQTSVNPEAGTREIFAGDTFITRLRFSLQSIMYKSVEGISTSYDALFKIGITAGSDGTLTISDSSKLSTALKNNLTDVINLFGFTSETSNKGIAVQIKNALSGLVGTDGQIEATRTTLNSQLTSLNNRITAMNKRVDKQVEQYKAQFTKMIAAYQEALAQQQSLSTLTDALYSQYY